MITIIAAVSRNGVIGKYGKLPWRVPEDLKRFKALTTGHTVVMGRKTWDSIGRPLPNRKNVVVTRSDLVVPDGVIVEHRFDESWFEVAGVCGVDTFVIGGAEIYRAALPHADRVELTRIEADVEGDVYFPDWDTWWVGKFESEKSETRTADGVPFAYTFETWRRKR